MNLEELKTLEEPSLVNCNCEDALVSLEAEIPEVLYKGMKDFIGNNPHWDQYRLMSSAFANFLFQNGSED